MGAVSGLGVGIAQGAMLGNTKRMLGWSAATAALWAVGWTVTTAGGIDVERAVGRVRRLRRHHLHLPAEHDHRRVHSGQGGDVMTAGTHVVFGTGPAGRAVADALLDQGTRVRMVNRSGTPVITGVETIGGDATDVDFARDVAADADTVYFCLNAPNYHRWAEEFPPLQRAVSAQPSRRTPSSSSSRTCTCTARAAGPLRETTPVNPTSAKSRTRAAMSAELLDAHQRGEVRVVIGRASDFIGPGVRDSAFGEFVFEPALAGKRAQTMGRPDTLHTYSYVPDVGRNLVLLGSRDDAYGQAWHLPNPDDPHHPAASSSTSTPRPGSAAPTSPRSSGRCCERSGCSTATSASSCTPTTSSTRRSSSTTRRSATRSAATRRSWDDIVASTVDWYRAHAAHARVRPPVSPRPQP